MGSITDCSCPLCGGKIQDRDKFYGCSNYKHKDGNCKFRIWKKLFTVPLSEKNIKELILKGITEDKVDGFFSKNKGNEPFSTRLYYNKQMNMVRFYYENENQ